MDRPEAERRARELVDRFAFLLPDAEKIRAVVAEVCANALQTALQAAYQRGRKEAAEEFSDAGRRASELREQGLRLMAEGREKDDAAFGIEGKNG